MARFKPGQLCRVVATTPGFESLLGEVVEILRVEHVSHFGTYYAIGGPAAQRFIAANPPPLGAAKENLLARESALAPISDGDAPKASWDVIERFTGGWNPTKVREPAQPVT